jgi:hypothetical protein
MRIGHHVGRMDAASLAQRFRRLRYRLPRIRPIYLCTEHFEETWADEPPGAAWIGVRALRVP